MAQKAIDFKIYNEAIEAFEDYSIKTTANAVKVSDDETLEDKLADIELRLDGTSAFIISDEPPTEPVNGQVWFKPVIIEDDEEDV